MSAKNKNATKHKKSALLRLSLPELRQAFTAATGKQTSSRSRILLVQGIEKARAAAPRRAAVAQSSPTTRRRPRDLEAVPMPVSTPPPEPSAPNSKVRGRFSKLTGEELRSLYREKVGRDTQSSNKDYLIWKIREVESGRVAAGPRKVLERNGEPLAMKVIPLRMETGVADKVDQIWRANGFRSRTEFLESSIGHCLESLGAHDVAALIKANRTTA